MASTIYALSTAPGRAAIAVVRLSGPEAHRAVAALIGRPVVADRRMRRATLRHPHTGETLDDALVVAFAEGASFTSEAMAELHLHGGRAIANSVLEALAAYDGLSVAEPGAFTRRAFEAGRLDLSQAEGLADLIDAETAAQHRQAVRMLDGALSRKVAEWREAILSALALTEAVIDFSDEELPGDLYDTASSSIERLAASLDEDLRGAFSAQRVREGFEVALVGPPNVGKSSLMNAIAGREVALTSEVAGTTRDVIEVRCDLGGIAVTFLDMAGLRESGDPVERAGVARARERAAQADLRIFVSDPDVEADVASAQPGDIFVVNKSDLGDRGSARLQVSAKTGAGVAALLGRVQVALAARSQGAGALTRARHVEAVTRARAALARAESNADVAIRAEELRLAARHLGRIVGAVDVEDVLGEIFSRFCLGK